MANKYNNALKKKLCEDICCNGYSTIKNAEEYGAPLKTLEKWILLLIKIIIVSILLVNLITLILFLLLNKIPFMMIYLQMNLKNYWLKKLSSHQTKYFGEKGIRFFLQKEYEVIFELFDKYSVLTLCNEMNINRSGLWYKKRNTLI